MEKIYKDLIVHSFFDFCVRCDDIYTCFWTLYSPKNDIAKYRDYLLYNVIFSKNKVKQELYAGLCWEFLMGDISKFDLYKNIYCKRKEL